MSSILQKCAAMFFTNIFFNILVPDHDAQVFQTLTVENTKIFDETVSFCLSGFTRWDAQYFLHIAQYGYTHENTLAFFPLFPLLIHMLFYLLSPLMLMVLSAHNCLLLIGAVLNVLLFVKSAVVLYKLSFLIFKCMSTAFVTSLLFCLNPSSIFFSAIYSESLFSVLTFTGLLYLKRDTVWISLLLLGLSAATRSNGLLSLGFIIHHELHHAVLAIYTSRFHFMSFFSTFLLRIFFMTLAFILPFAAYQAYAYSLYCFPGSQDFSKVIEGYIQTQGYKLAGSGVSEWCHWKLPVSYTYVQEKYWNVGFLRYYEFKQIPNFVLAFPILLLVVYSSLKYFKENYGLMWHLGLMYDKEVNTYLYCNKEMFVFFTHAFVLSVVCSAFIHVQVSTRLFSSSSPMIYWIIASSIVLPETKSKFQDIPENTLYNSVVIGDFYYLYNLATRAPVNAKAAYYYFILYFVVGTLLHVNYLPWT